MSEYQSYEFRALDRRLTDEELAALRQLSTRAEISPTSFSNEYHFGDFKGEPRQLVERYFDVFVYNANWGTRHCLFGFPRSAVDIAELQAYEDGEAITVTATDERVMVELYVEDECCEWVEEGPHWIDRLVGLRDELLAGDYRPLYLAWLSTLHPGAAEAGQVEDDEAFAPPVPAGLGKLTATQKALAEFFAVDRDLLQEAAQGSLPPGAGFDEAEVRAWVRAWPAERKAELLEALLDGTVPNPLATVRRAYLREAAPAVPAPARSRPVRELEAAAARRAAQRQAREQAAAEQARQRREAAEKAARDQHLDSLAGSEELLWRSAQGLIDLTQPKPYDEAVAILRDLRDLAARDGALSEFEIRVGEMREQYRRRPSLLERLDKAGL